MIRLKRKVMIVSLSLNPILANLKRDRQGKKIRRVIIPADLSL